MKVIASIVFLLLLASCSNSLIYSPGLSLPAKQIKEQQTDVSAGFEMLPEANVPKSNENFAYGANFQLTHGFSDKFNLGFRGAVDIGNTNNFRSAFLLNSNYTIANLSFADLILNNRVGISLNENSIDGYGISCGLIFANQIQDNIRFYSGPNLAWGFNQLGERSVDNIEAYPHGIGILLNVGISWEFIDGLRLNAEINPTYQINLFYDETHLIISPQISLGYTFR